MGSRIYDITLTCGCMISLDKGGGLIPCAGHPMYLLNHDPSEDEEIQKHDKAWKEYREGPQFQQHQEEIERRNQ